MVLIFITAFAVFAFTSKKITLVGSFVGSIIAYTLWFSFGYSGILLIFTFFILGTLSTMWGIKKKFSSGLSENITSKRDVYQVLANAGIPFLLCIYCTFFSTHHEAILLMIAGSFSSATADTVSSEMGNLYGKNFYNIITLKKDTKGLNGVVSVEGTLFGIAGSCILATLYSISTSWNIQFLLVILAGTMGNFSDSILGATLERKEYLNNNQVNFINTAVGAATSCLLFLLCS